MGSFPFLRISVIPFKLSLKISSVNYYAESGNRSEHMLAELSWPHMYFFIVFVLHIRKEKIYSPNRISYNAGVQKSEHDTRLL